MRIFTDGAEMQDILFWDGSFNAPPVAVASATPFVSPYYYVIASGGSRYSWRNFSALSECYARVRVRTNVLSTSPTFLDLRTGTTSVAGVSLNGINQWIASVTTVGVVGTAASAMVADTWYLLEVYFKEANAPNGRFVVKIDGNIVIDYTGDTQPAAATTFDNIRVEGGTGSAVLVDDLALNDTSNADGLNDNSWVGDGIILKAPPTGDGTTNNWTNSAGTSVNNWSYVDEFPKDDDVTYVYHDGSFAGHQDQYALTCPSLTGYTVLRIYPEARCRKTAAVAHTVKVGTLAAGGADVMSPARNLLVTAYSRVVGTDQKVNPVDGNPWEEADINALEFVVETG